MSPELFGRGRANRTKTIAFRCTQAEFDWLVERAAAGNFTGVSDLIRETLLEARLSSTQDRRTSADQTTPRRRSQRK